MIAAALIERRFFFVALFAIIAYHAARELRARIERLPLAPSVSEVPEQPRAANRSDFSAARILAANAPDFQPSPLLLSAAGAPRGIVDFLLSLERRIVGPPHLVHALVTALIAGGHVLIEGPPGSGKTFACGVLAASLGGRFGRAQCTADLTPSEIVGCEIYDTRDSDFHPRFGPIFANVLLLDEINRAPARTQAALLEAMQERQVTIGNVSYPLPDVFMTVATMNEGEEEGIYRLPAAQLDRFMFSIPAVYPNRSDEIAFIRRDGEAQNDTPPVALEDIAAWRARALRIECPPSVAAYAVDLSRASRTEAGGGGPRATLSLIAAARVRAMVNGRSSVWAHDVRAFAADVLRHRLPRPRLESITRFDRSATNAVLQETIAKVPMP